MDGSMHNGGFQIDRNSWDLAPALIWVSLSVDGGPSPQCRADAAGLGWGHIVSRGLGVKLR